VHFLGPRSRPGLAALLRDASLVLVPSHSETYGLIALEAAASGVPVIAAASGGLRESVVDGVTGIVLPLRDPRTWARAVTQVLADAGLRDRLSRASRSHALDHPWSRSSADLVDVYCGVLDRQGSPCVAASA
jgi:D-inositol-3-phosphate glycosyltransferase